VKHYSLCVQRHTRGIRVCAVFSTPPWGTILHARCWSGGLVAARGNDAHRVQEEEVDVPMAPKRYQEPVVALVGLPNCGKSTLFNRLVRQNKSLVTSEPGTTRDRVYAYCEIVSRTVMVVDTGGMVGTGDFFSPLIHEQALVAINEADIILFMFDRRQGVSRKDVEVARLLRQHTKKKRIILVANKCDDPYTMMDVEERNKIATGKSDDHLQLGLGPAFPVSAIHGGGTGELLDHIYNILQSDFPEDNENDEEEEEKAQRRVSISIVGRPNVGKSSFLNQVLGRDRVIVTEVPGTTHDAVDHNILWKGKKPRHKATNKGLGKGKEDKIEPPAGKEQGIPIRLVDTAGINRRATHTKGLERSSVLWSIKAINRSDVVLLLIDVTQGITDQDMRIAERILECKAAAIVVVNKWDLSKEKTHKWEKYVRDTLKFMKYVPIMFCSALTGKNVKETIDLAVRVFKERGHFINTSTLMKLVESANARHRPPSKNGKQLKIRYATQAKVRAPSFAFFVNDVDLVHFSYQRFLENAIRELHPFIGSPMRLIFKDKEKTVVS